MNFSWDYNQKSNYDINNFFKSLGSLKYLLDILQSSNQYATGKDVKFVFEKFIYELVDKTTRLNRETMALSVTLEKLLSAKDFDGIIRKVNKNDVFDELLKVEFNGNLQNDVISLMKKFYINEYVDKIEESKNYLGQDLKDTTLWNRYEREKEEFEKIKEGRLSVQEETKHKEKMREYFEVVNRRLKNVRRTDLVCHLYSTLNFLNMMGFMHEYTDRYNNFAKEINMFDILGIKDEHKLIEDLLDENKMQGMEDSELIALNAFWTNRLAKEVDNISKALFVVDKFNLWDQLRENGKIEIQEAKLAKTLEEYRLIRDKVNKVRVIAVKNVNVESVDREEDSNIATLLLDAETLFSKREINYWGLGKLKTLISQSLRYINPAQILYDKKDMLMEFLLVKVLNGQVRQNCGYIEEEQAKDSKCLIGIDLKGYNAPIMLHYHENTVFEIAKRITGDTKIGMYRGAQNLQIPLQNRTKIAATNMLYPLNKEQRKALASWRNNIKPNSDESRYVKHIAWNLRSNKEMPPDIAEPYRYIDLETGEITIDEPDVEKDFK